MNVPELTLNYEELYAKRKTIGLKELSSQTNGDEDGTARNTNMGKSEIWRKRIEMDYAQYLHNEADPSC